MQARQRLLSNGAGTIAAIPLQVDYLLVRLDGTGSTHASARYAADIVTDGIGAVTVEGAPKCTVKAVAGGPIACGAVRARISPNATSFPISPAGIASPTARPRREIGRRVAPPRDSASPDARAWGGPRSAPERDRCGSRPARLRPRRNCRIGERATSVCLMIQNSEPPPPIDAHDFLVPLGQIARGEEHRPRLAPAARRRSDKMLEAGRAERDLGEMKRHFSGFG